jgi:hypothetical protein
MRTLLALAGVGLIGFLPAALVAPELAAEAFGTAADSPEARTYLTAAAIRDAALGVGVLAALALGASRRVLAGLVFALAVVAGGDAVNVVAHHGFTGIAPVIHIGSFVGLVVFGLWVWPRRLP